MAFIINGVEKQKAVPISLCDDLQIAHDYHVLDTNVTANLVGELNYLDGLWVLNGRLSAKLLFPCDLCLQPVEFVLDCEVLERFSDADADLAKEIDEEIWHFSAKTIDFEPMVRALLLLNMPLRTVCDESCKGLCQVCGQNLNNGECGCENFHTDPRFEILRSLF